MSGSHTNYRQSIGRFSDLRFNGFAGAKQTELVALQFCNKEDM
jgi:hypothetical protein